jgi:uncharacterized Fe-S cluster protein YjdI
MLHFARRLNSSSRGMSASAPASMSKQVELEGLLGEAQALLEGVDGTTAQRLSRSVVRPLEELGLKPEGRCGASNLKPLCDGSHRDVGFSGAKDPNRVPQRRDSFDGLQLTVLDNRGLCAHSGFCTDRLNTVFHADNEPFVTPSGGRLDEIIQPLEISTAGRRC